MRMVRVLVVQLSRAETPELVRSERRELRRNTVRNSKEERAEVRRDQSVE